MAGGAAGGADVGDDEQQLQDQLRQLELVDARTGEGRVDLVLFHAVIEWAAEPFEALQVLEKLLRPMTDGQRGGLLSCLFYNKPALVWRHLMNGSFERADNPTGVSKAAEATGGENGGDGSNAPPSKKNKKRFKKK